MSKHKVVLKSQTWKMHKEIYRKTDDSSNILEKKQNMK